MPDPCKPCSDRHGNTYSPGPPPLPSPKTALIRILTGSKVQHIAIPLDKPDHPHAIIWQQLKDNRYISKRLDSMDPTNGIVLEITCVAVIAPVASVR